MAVRPMIGQSLQQGDRVVVDGRDVTRLLAVERKLQVIVYHKPTGEMLRRRAGDEREGVEMHLPALHAGRWVAINALGYGEDGLLLLASEGPFALAIARRGHELAVEYRVRALRPSPGRAVARDAARRRRRRTTVTFTPVEPAGGSDINMWFKVASDRTLPRGAIRALFDAAGLKVSRVMLVKWGPIALPRDLPRGRIRALEGARSRCALRARRAVTRQRAPKTKTRRATKRPPPDRRRKTSATARRTGNR